MNVFILVAGTSDIAQKTAEILKSQDHEVILTGRNEETVKGVSERLGCKYRVVDPKNFDETLECFNSIKEEHSEISGVVNFPGSIFLKPISKVSEEDYQEVIDVNLKTSFSVSRAASQILREGSIVLMSSAVAEIGVVNHEAISAAKSGINGLARSLAASLASKNIRVNVVAPSLTNTKLVKAIVENEFAKKASETMHALGRLGQAEDQARMISFLLDPQNSWITGQVFGVDGGLSRVQPKIKV